MGWEQYQGGNFRATVGAALWGEKATDVAVGGPDAAKLDVVFLIKIPKVWIDHACRRCAWTRESIKIVPRSFLIQKGAEFFRQKLSAS